MKAGVELWSNFHVGTIKNLCDSLHAHRNYKQFLVCSQEIRKRRKRNIVDLLRLCHHFGLTATQIRACLNISCKYIVRFQIHTTDDDNVATAGKGICPNYHSQTMARRFSIHRHQNTCHSVCIHVYRVHSSATYMQMDASSQRRRKKYRCHAGCKCKNT